MTITRVSDYSVYESRDPSCRLMECHDTSVYLACSPGGYSQKNWVGVCGALPKTLTLFMTKICDIILLYYYIYDLTKNSKPYLRPDP